MLVHVCCVASIEDLSKACSETSCLIRVSSKKNRTKREKEMLELHKSHNFSGLHSERVKESPKSPYRNSLFYGEK